MPGARDDSRTGQRNQKISTLDRIFQVNFFRVTSNSEHSGSLFPAVSATHARHVKHVHSESPRRRSNARTDKIIFYFSPFRAHLLEMIYPRNIVCGFSFFWKLISLHGYVRVRFAREHNIFSYVIRPAPPPCCRRVPFARSHQRVFSTRLLNARRECFKSTYILMYTRTRTLTYIYIYIYTYTDAARTEQKR